MVHRIIYGLCGLILLGFVSQEIWEKVSFSPHRIIEASYAQNQHLNGKGVVVAIIDEGFDSSHTFLRNNFSPYRYNTNNKTRDISETFIFQSGKYTPESHGTHVTGIILALAPQADIIPIKVSGLGGDRAFVKALQIAAFSPAHIVNISLQLSYTGRAISPNVRKALIQLANEGKLIVIAAGNESSSLMRSAYTSSLVELAHDSLMKGRLLFVGASSYKNGVETLAEFSNYPGESLFGKAYAYFIVAPGEHINSTITGGDFGKKSGTSMAAPMVVGAATLLKQAFPHLRAEDIAQLLLTSARKSSLEGKSLPQIYFGAGIVNLRSALKQGEAL